MPFSFLNWLLTGFVMIHPTVSVVVAIFSVATYLMGIAVRRYAASKPKRET